MQTGGEMKSAVRALVGEESLGIAVNRLKGGCVKRGCVKRCEERKSWLAFIFYAEFNNYICVYICMGDIREMGVRSIERCFFNKWVNEKYNGNLI
ncbi:hypothetical protein [Bartonella sp. TT67HLJMS]|uniref:hypothetical protein n=1 Tax=Bartonella sp. TT67HLJMS TaxID=3243582 RepID=UPI0035CFEEB5